MEPAAQRPPRRRVLFILPDFEAPPTKGYQVRCAELAAGLGRRYLSRIISTRRSSAIEGLDADARPLWRLVTLITQLVRRGPLQAALFDGPDVVRRVKKVVAEWQPDVVVTITERLPITALALAGDTLVVDVVDSMRLHMSERGRRAPFPLSVLWRIEAAAFRRLAGRLDRHAAAVVIASNTALADHPGAIVIENAARRSAFPRPPATIDAVFTGNLAYWPNARAALELCRDIAPLIRAALPSVRIVIAGRDPGPELRQAAANAAVTLMANVADIDAVLRSSRLALAPVEWTPGANLKVMEALAAGTPVLAYRAAAERLPASTVGVRACEGSEDMARIALSVLEGRETIDVGDRDQHTWSARARILEQLLDRAVRP